ncbi:MAG: double-strand break repair protein AddB, partial [Alphaproteobacteria bacterium]
MTGVVSIPAEAPFAATLARGLLAEHGPRGLARLRLVLPSRRACLVMQEAFLEANGGQPLLPPRLIPVGDAAGELGLLDAAAEWGVPPALGDLRRRFLLFELVRRVEAELPDEQAFRLADALRALLDELDQEDVPVAALAGLEAGDAPAHWQRIARFLDLLAGSWGGIEAEAGGIGRVARRGRLLQEVAGRWGADDPGAVVVAGVTGSVPAVAALMATVAALPAGRVVLPGVDPEPALGLAQAMGPAHPQWGFARLLERLGLDLEAVPRWPDDLGAPDQRRRLLSAMTTPAALTPPAVDLDGALKGVEIVEAPDVASEALAVALRLRALLETDARALVVAPDRQLARRIAAELKRFDLAVEDSAGQPLDQTAPGTFALLVAHACLDADPVVASLAMLKHPL